ncbi:TPA: hypothetical protein DCF80_00700 [Candidatus Saccharibacteria bacterium]|nr:hypothetical protein [Candidatus Saccharibacteria bacterium]HRK40590.1 hypothetical protein [Candidatus Saccharibacteria bacterium]
MTLTIVDPTSPVDYSTPVTPPSYVCGMCGKSGVKLWRTGSTMSLDTVDLACADCAAGYESEDISTMDPVTGKYMIRDLQMRCDQIGNYMPAVPTAENDAFWRYTCAPQEGIAWWYSLPLR